MYRRRKGGVKKIVRKWGVLMSAMLKQKLIDIANGFTKYGLWKGGGSSNLSELDDVALTNLQTNDVLTYNGSVWVNDDNLQKQIDTLNSNLSSNIIYRTVVIDSVSVNQHGYAVISSYIPSIDGYSLLNANIITWSAGLPYNITADGVYLIGPQSITITNLKIKYIFIRN